MPGPTYDATQGRPAGRHAGADDRRLRRHGRHRRRHQPPSPPSGITPVAKSLDVDLGGLLTTLDPTGGFFGHDKVEGVATTDGGKTLVVSNDNDFGIDGVTNAAPPFPLHAKILPNGQQDDGEYLAIDTTKLGDPTSTATVSIFVTPPGIHG